MSLSYSLVKMSVYQKVHEDRRITIKKIVEDTDLSDHVVCSVITTELEMKMKCYLQYGHREF